MNFIVRVLANPCKLDQDLPTCGLADSWMTKASETPT